MVALPPSSDFIGSTRSNAEMRITHAALRDYLAGLLGADGTAATALGTLGAMVAGYQAKTAAYTVTTAERGQVFSCTGTWTLGLPGVFVVGAGWAVVVHNAGSGTITIDPAGAQQIEGATTMPLPAGRAAILVCTGTAWVVLWLPRPVDSPTDATAGRVLTTGYMGLGGLAPLVGNISVTDNTLTPGTYFYDTTQGSTGGPPSAGTVRAIVIHARRGVGGGEVQTLVIEGAGAAYAAGSVFTRSRVSAAWSAWSMAYGQANIIGAVAQAGGLPTSALIERGDGANGSYVRWACGTQLCWRTIDDTATAWATATGSIFTRASALSWTYPAAFSTAPVIKGGIQRDAAVGGGVNARTVTTTAAGLQPFATASQAAAVAKSVHVEAIGRWF